MKTRLSRCLNVAAIATAAVTTALSAQSAPTDSAIRSWLTPRVDNGYATGIVAGHRTGTQNSVIAVGGTERSGKPLGADTFFEIGSITKVFTNILLADMVIKGEVTLDDPVAKYLPGTVTVPSRNEKEITLLNLATASSGLPSLPDNFKPADVCNPYADYTVTQLYAFLTSHTLRRDPGAQYEYSNVGMGLLGHVLALRAGKSYEALLRERVLEPLGMRNTYIVMPDSQQARFAVPHDVDLDDTCAWDLPTLAGAGALRSTTSDMLRFAEAVTHRDRGPLGTAITMSIEPRRPTTIPGTRIALGWHVRDNAGQQIVWHNGGTGGFRTFFGFDPASGANSMVWSNTSSSVDDIGLRMLDSTTRLRPTPPQVSVTVPAATLRSYVGEYPLSQAFVLTITESNGKLYVQATNQPRFRLWARSDSSFALRVVRANVDFTRGADGVVSATLDQNGTKTTAARR